MWLLLALLAVQVISYHFLCKATISIRVQKVPHIPSVILQRHCCSPEVFWESCGLSANLFFWWCIGHSSPSARGERWLVFVFWQPHAEVELGCFLMRCWTRSTPCYCWLPYHSDVQPVWSQVTSVHLTSYIGHHHISPLLRATFSPKQPSCKALYHEVQSATYVQLITWSLVQWWRYWNMC